jgi:hypothetical protein
VGARFTNVSRTKRRERAQTLAARGIEERKTKGLATTRPALEKGIGEYRKWLDESLALTRHMAHQWAVNYHRQQKKHA